MTREMARHTLWAGVAMLVLATVLGAATDGLAKFLSGRLPVAEVLMMANGFVALITFWVAKGMTRFSHQKVDCLTTKRPDLLMLRCLTTVVSAFAFFLAVKLLPLTQVFLFVGLTPVMAAALSKLVLKDGIGRAEWAGLCLGAFGVAVLFLGDLSWPGLGHWAGFTGAFAGTISLMLSRRMAQFEKNAMVQVFYPNLCVALVAALWAVWDIHPIGLTEFWVGLLFGLCMFLGRWSLVIAMRNLRPTVAFPLANIQFVWMAMIGYHHFGEVPTVQTVIGAGLVGLAGAVALLCQARVDRALPSLRAQTAQA
ncbi:DMT family transporter [Pseudorhodobacter sp. E13]|uniref:DMT family transporter n=1 Tax=Pseudorhodobacter sp. E13 TaxID=2487931 RepID=UPI0013158D33|nr:DMT family transporter [Pseudorhodobacter sp. E13]